MLRRSQLYVPGNSERMVAKAAGLEADSVVLDLEDAVPEDEKEGARALVSRAAASLEWGRRELCVRINGAGSRHFAGDLAAVRKMARVDAVLIPRAEGDCSSIHTKCGKKTIPMIETAAGLARLWEVAASRGVTALAYAAADYAASVGGAVDAYLDNQAVKTMVVAAAKAVGAEALDNVFFALEDLDGFRRQALAAKALGYSGKQVVHPSQVMVANAVFSPTAEELEWARRVVAKFSAAASRKKGAIRVDGSLVDAVHYRLATGLLEKQAELSRR